MEQWVESASFAEMSVAWHEDVRLLVAEGEVGGAIACDAVANDMILRVCVRSGAVEGGGVGLADGRRKAAMEKGKAEMEKQTEAATVYAKHTKRVLELVLVGTEKEGHLVVALG